MPTGHQKIMKQEEFPAIYLSFSLHGQPSLEGKYNPLRMCIETEQTGNRTTTSCSGCYFLKREKKIYVVKLNMTHKTTI
jgi:ribosomal protein L36